MLATATRQDSGAPFERPALFVAITESGLASKVTAGENRGETLRHDHVVRAELFFDPQTRTPRGPQGLLRLGAACLRG